MHRKNLHDRWINWIREVERGKVCVNMNGDQREYFYVKLSEENGGSICCLVGSCVLVVEVHALANAIKRLI